MNFHHLSFKINEKNSTKHHLKNLKKKNFKKIMTIWRAPSPNQKAYFDLYYDIANIYGMLDYVPVEFVPRAAIVDLQEADRLIGSCVEDGL